MVHKLPAPGPFMRLLIGLCTVLYRAGGGSPKLPSSFGPLHILCSSTLMVLCNSLTLCGMQVLPWPRGCSPHPILASKVKRRS